MVDKFISNIGEGLTARWMVKQQKKELANLKESTFIPPSLLQAESMASKLTNATRYAGQDVDEANIRQASGNAFSNVARSTTSPVNLTNAALQIQATENKAMSGVSRTLQTFKDRNQANWTNLLIQKAGAQAKNRNQYEAAKSALQGAILQNKARSRNAFWNAGASVGEGVEAYLTGGLSEFAKKPQSSSNSFSDWAGKNGY